MGSTAAVAAASELPLFTLRFALNALVHYVSKKGKHKRCGRSSTMRGAPESMSEHHTPAPASVAHAAGELLTHHRHASTVQFNVEVHSWTFSHDIDACGAVPELTWREAARLTAVAAPSRYPATPAVNDDVVPLRH